MMEALPTEYRIGIEEFVEKAVYFSESRRIDMDLYREEDVVEAHFYFKEERFAGLFKLEWESLLRCATAFYVMDANKKENKIEWILVCKK